MTKKDNVVKTIFRARQRKQQITMGELYPFDQAKAPVKDKAKEWATLLQNECTHENGGEIPCRSMIVSETVGKARQSVTAFTVYRCSCMIAVKQSQSIHKRVVSVRLVDTMVHGEAVRIARRGKSNVTHGCEP